MLIIVGSGRSGTKSFAEFYDAPHEPNQKPTSYLASAYSHGWLTEDQVARVLSEWEWPKIWADYKQAELIPVTAQMDPHPNYLWVVRNPGDTVASMVRKHWYLPADDHYPPGYFSFYKQHPDDERPIEMTVYNHPGNRTRGHLVGDFSLEEWSEMGQVERCGWWWNWVNKRIYEQFLVYEGRFTVVRLEDAVAAGDELGELLLGEPRSLPVANQSEPEPVVGWESYVGEMSKVLGY